MHFWCAFLFGDEGDLVMRFLMVMAMEDLYIFAATGVISYSILAD